MMASHEGTKESRFIFLSDRSETKLSPASFRARYGALCLDIAERITGSGVRVGKKDLSVAEAAIPEGSHRLLLEVRDTKGRTGESALRFTVE